jgi:hypothetical protein
MNVDDLSSDLECDVNLLVARNCPDGSQGIDSHKLSASHTAIKTVGNHSVEPLILQVGRLAVVAYFGT